jgi:hypothetical protein
LTGQPIDGGRADAAERTDHDSAAHGIVEI